MLGIVYLFVCFFFGLQLLRFLFPDPQRLYIGIAPRKSNLTLIPTILFYYPAGFILGLVLVTFLTYWVALLMTPFVPQEMPVLYPANVVSLCLAIYLGSAFWQKAYERKNPPIPEPEAEEEPVRRHLGGHVKPAAAVPPVRKPLAPGFAATKKSVIYYVLSILFFITAGSVLFYYSFYVSGGKVNAGYSVFSDLAPHTALLSSFSKGMNFPTVYPHFPNDGIRYHFFFYFLCGNLNALGMRIDHALNVPSILVMVCCFMLLGVLAVLLSGKRRTFLLAPVLVLFRSSFAVVSQIRELAALPCATLNSVLHGILTNSLWIGTTPRDNWGLWSINVYANQRHLLLGAALILLLIFLFLPHVRRMFLHIHKAKGFKAKIKHFLFCREAWIPRLKDPLHPYALCVTALLVVLCMPYFHGSALVAALIILALMAVISENRLSYAVVAGAAIGSSLLQTQYFSGGAANVVSFAYYWGFLIEDPTLLNIALYIGKMMGAAAVLIVLLLFVQVIVQKSFYRTFLLIAFAVPAVLAFFFTLTIDVTANHKFIQISLILFSIYLASLLLFLWNPFSGRHKHADFRADADPQELPARIHPVRRVVTLTAARILAVILFLSLTATGVSEWIVYYNLNKNNIQMDLTSPMVSWIETNTHPKDVFLTASYSMNTFFLSGRSAYYGHPYYAWSAGYNTESRMALYAELLTGCAGIKADFLALCQQENISYVLIDNDMRNQADFPLDEAFFMENFAAAAVFPDENNTVIYKVE